MCAAAHACHGTPTPARGIPSAKNIIPTTPKGLPVAPDDIALILHRLDAQDAALLEIRNDVKRVNGDLTLMKLWKARMEGVQATFNWFGPVLGGAVGASAATAVALLLR
jgi:hypothetical protein